MRTESKESGTGASVAWACCHQVLKSAYMTRGLTNAIVVGDLGPQLVSPI